MLILWDIDQTLIEAGHMDRLIWSTIAAGLLKTSRQEIQIVQGATIRTIMRSALQTHGANQEMAQKLLPNALRQEIELLQNLECIRTSGRILPGAYESLSRIAKRSEVVQSILTGNQRESAKLKLKAFDLDRHVDLDVGAYGSDSEFRPSLVPIARERTNLKYEKNIAEQTVLIGDSIRDIQAARENHIPIITVSTGDTSAKSLIEAGADFVLPDLTHTRELDEALDILLAP